MGISIIVGGQLGSEGKGKVAHAFAKKNKSSIAVRVGGTNSGHTVIGEDGVKYTLRMLPAPAIIPGMISILPAGSYIDIDILMCELVMLGIHNHQLKIDPNAMILKRDDINHETNGTDLLSRIGSTCSGTGTSVVRRISRGDGITASSVVALQPFLADTKRYMRNALDNDQNIIIEGTQGYGLSVLHAKDYPYATSRDTTAAGFLSEAGLSPLDVSEIIMVIRSYPIRVGGNSGPLPYEIDWDTVTKESGAPSNIEEYTSVTNRLRRVGRFNSDMVKDAIIANKPTSIVLNHMDYIDYTAHDSWTVTEKMQKFVKMAEEVLDTKIDYIGTGARALFKFYVGGI